MRGDRRGRLYVIEYDHSAKTLLRGEGIHPPLDSCNCRGEGGYHETPRTARTRAVGLRSRAAVRFARPWLPLRKKPRRLRRPPVRPLGGERHRRRSASRGARHRPLHAATPQSGGAPPRGTKVARDAIHASEARHVARLTSRHNCAESRKRSKRNRLEPKAKSRIPAQPH